MKTLVFLLTIIPIITLAEVNFFEDDINFWNEKKESKQIQKTSTKKYKRLQSSIFIKTLTHKSKFLIT